MVDFFDLLKERRSIRDFEEKDVPMETVMEIIRESCLAPSSGNGQPWRFIIINDKALIRRLSDESKKNILFYIEKNPGAYFKKYEVALRNKDFNVFYNAPCLVYIGGSKRFGQSRWIVRLLPLISCFLLLQGGWALAGSVWEQVYRILDSWSVSGWPRITGLWLRSSWAIRGLSRTFLKEWSLRFSKQSVDEWA